MTENKFMLISMDDSKAKSLADVLGSKTCKKIIDYLTDNKEASAKDLSDELNIPLNTLDYNIKKLLKSELIQKKKNFFWSVKGKKIALYELSNKSIIIAPRNQEISEKIKSILPAFILTGALTFGVYVFEKFNSFSEAVSQSIIQDSLSVGNVYYGAESAKGVAEIVTEEVVRATQPIASDILINAPSTGWIWFLAGALLTIGIFSIINWRKL